MGKHKLQRFAELETLERVFQPASAYSSMEYYLKGKWHSDVFHNSNPIVLELGCGKGEYTVNMARMFPGSNFIGVDRKGARLWRGAKTINEESVLNAAFLRGQVQHLSNIFAPGEVNDIWITFPDPQPQKSREKSRLTAPRFLDMYQSLIAPGGLVRLKTDSSPLYEYSLETATAFGATIETATSDLYGTLPADEVLSIKTTYEKRFLAEGLKICYLTFRFKA